MDIIKKEKIKVLKVMQTVNNYDKDVFNGDIGRIVKLDDIDQELVAQFDDRKVTYEFNELDEIMLSYTTTVHKCQGSEYLVLLNVISTQQTPIMEVQTGSAVT